MSQVIDNKTGQPINPLQPDLPLSANWSNPNSDPVGDLEKCFDSEEGLKARTNTTIYGYCLTFHLAKLAIKSFKKFNGLICQTYLTELYTRDKEMYNAVLLDIATDEETARLAI